MVVRSYARPGYPLRRQPHDVGGKLQRRHADPDERQQPHDAQRVQRERKHERLDARAPHPQYSVCPRRSRNWRIEKPMMIANSTQAMAEAAPNWKKFWNAVS